ncbi:prmB [Symbiodinium natans]|uniref:PrmB protein n=1 Tax=Symbiodinium natans TaxID=878477 RepID=A0A812MYF4_9DINO|nr:prmB [Symbiodinium natans]
MSPSGLGFDVVVANPPYLTRAQAEELLGPRLQAKEPWQAFVFQRTAKVMAALGGHKGHVDGAIAAYSVLLMALDAAHTSGYDLLEEGGLLVLEVPAALEASVPRALAHAKALQAPPPKPPGPSRHCPVCCKDAVGMLWRLFGRGSSKSDSPPPDLLGSLKLEERRGLASLRRSTGLPCIKEGSGLDLT